MDLAGAKSYDLLVNYGKPSLADHVKERWNSGRSVIAAGAAQSSVLLAYLVKDQVHRAVKLDGEAYERLVTWMDTYAQRQGHFSPQQEEDLAQFRREAADLLER